MASKRASFAICGEWVVTTNWTGQGLFVELGDSGASDLVELSDEDLLHLGMQVRLRFLDKDQMYAGCRRRSLILAEEPQQLK